jgi:hypothetical protein
MKKRLIVFFMCIVFIMGLTIGNLTAAELNETITAVLNKTLTIKLNGKEYIPLDADGSRLYPISYKGRTYLPVRALAEAVSLAVDYKDNVVYLGEKDRIPLVGEDFENLWTSQFSENKSSLLVNGKQYNWGIVFTGKESGIYEFSGFVYPKAKYQKFGGIVCMDDTDGSTEEVVVRIRENDYEGRVLKEITVKKGESIPFEIDIANIKTLYIQNLVIDRTPKNTNPDILMIAEPYFK